LVDRDSTHALCEQRLAEVTERLEDLYQATWEFMQALDSGEDQRRLRAREKLEKTLLGI